jgi:hypothetical protein
MKSSLEKRLDRLREQESHIQEAIKKIEQEKKQELRKIRKKKEALIGAMVMEIMDKAQPITITSESDLLSLLDGFLNRKTDRTLFGLDEVTITTPANDSSPTAKTDDATDDTEDKTQNSPTKTQEKKKTSSRRSSTKRLPVSKKQNDLADEFNTLNG